MSLPRFILTPESLNDSQIILTENDAHHARILRLQAGDAVLLADGAGREFYGEIVQLNKNQVLIRRGDATQRRPESALSISLYQGLTKADKWEWVIQKTTELGVARLIPVCCARSQVKPQAENGHRLSRWQEIARQAARQSGRTMIPVISPPLSLADAMSQTMDHEKNIVFHETGLADADWTQTLTPGDTGVGLWVGPEGGFEPQEIAMAKEHRMIKAGLGPRILRAETAAIVVVALAQFNWGDLGGRNERG